MIKCKRMVRVRLAPSPTGDPHVGTAYAALFNFVLAKKMAGRFILRIEDTDRKRVVPGAEEAIIASLKWLGLSWDEGPEVGGPFAPYRQSERLGLYQKCARELVKKGAAYYCFCTPQRLEKMRQEQKKAHLPPIYDGTCRQLKIEEAKLKRAKGEPCVIRLKVPKEGETKFQDLVRGEVKFKNVLIDDQILLKSDGYPTYHLGVVVDDHLMKISHVIRAEEWLPSTPKHLLLYQNFGWEIPQFAHLPILRNPDRTKISKRRHHTSLIWYRQQGYLPEALLNFLALMGWSHPQGLEIFSLSEMIKSFSFGRIVKSGPVFNLEKLDWLNGEYLRKKSLKELLALLKDWAEFSTFKIRTHDKKLLTKILALIKDRMKKLGEFENLSDFFFLKPDVDLNLLTTGKSPADTKVQIAATLEALKATLWQKEKIEERIRTVAQDLQTEPSHLFMTLRVALTGKTATPPLFETMEVLGQEETILRLEKILSRL